MKYKVVFFGTPEFSVPFLETLLKDADFEVVGVVTGEDKKSGRGQQLKQSPIAEYLCKIQNQNDKIIESSRLRTNNNKILFNSENDQNFQNNNKIPVFKFNKLTADSCKLITKLQPDVGVLVAYGKIIPKEIIDLFPEGIINVHPSILPKYRGPDPLRAAILAGDNKTGISIMKLDEKMDHGPIINQTEINISNYDNLENLYEKVIKIGPDFLIKSLKLYLKGKINPKPQNHRKSTYCKMIKKQDALINWNKPAIKIMQKINAFNPSPGAYTKIDNKIFKITKAQLINNKIQIKKITPEGKKNITWTQFLNGYKKNLPQKIIDKLYIL